MMCSMRIWYAICRIETISYQCKRNSSAHYIILFGIHSYIILKPLQYDQEFIINKSERENLTSVIPHTDTLRKVIPYFIGYCH